MKKLILFGMFLAVILVSGCARPVEEYCLDMSLSEAKELAVNSECGEKGTLKENYVCNNVTGTWWIDLDVFDDVWNELEVSKEMCNPACVINTETKEAVINWRCMGLIT